MGFDWLKNKRNQQKQKIKEKFLSQKSEIRCERRTADVFAHNKLGLHEPSRT